VGSEAAQSTLVFWKPSLFAGRRRKGTSGRVPAERGSLQPSRCRNAATRVLEGTFEEGKLARQTASPSLSALGPCRSRWRKSSRLARLAFTGWLLVRASVRGALRKQKVGE